MADENKAIKKPLPEITPVNQPFWDGAKAGKLMMQKCQNCGTWVFCPRPVCGDCASDKLEWVQVSGKGKIFSFTVIREVVGQALRGFAPDIPYVTAWIDLSGLLSPMERGGADVLNGIAYDEAGNRLFVTGKWWPRLFEIRLVRR